MGTSGTDVICVSTTNNVGINTSAPSEALEVVGNVKVDGFLYADANNQVPYKNRIVNGDMAVDIANAGAGVGGLSGSYLTSKVQPSAFHSVDRWEVASPNVAALTAKQVALGYADQVAIGSVSENAVEVGLVPKDGLGAYFRFDGSLGDSSGNGVTLTPTGTMQYGPGVVGNQSLYLANEANVNAGTAAANYIINPSYIFPQQFTISVWALATDLANNNKFVFNTNSTTSGPLNALGIFFTTTSVGITYFSVSDVLTPAVANTWYHIAMVYNNGLATCYVNGTNIGSISPSTSLYQSGFILGNAFVSNNQPFAGFIDDFRIYNRTLSATEIAALATSVGAPQAPPSTLASGLTTWLTFDNTTADAQGTLGAPTVTGTTVYTPVSKVGSAALDLTANTSVGGTPTTALVYTLSSGQYALPITMTGWMNPTSLSNSVKPFVIQNSTGVAVQISPSSSTSVQFAIYIGSWLVYNINYTFNLGSWYHLAIVASSNGYLNGYINGTIICSALLPSGTLGVLGTGNPNQLAVGTQGNTYAFQGYIDDVRIYNRALSSTEVAGLFAQSQYASYSLFRQTIEGSRLADLGWGTPAAQPATASMWIKNNSASAQQLTVSAGNTGSRMLAWIDFEGGSYADKLGFLTNATNVGASISTSTYKVGSGALNLSGNTPGGANSEYMLYNIPGSVNVPITISSWIYASAASSGWDVIWDLGNSSIITNWAIQLVYYNNELYVDIEFNGNNYNIPFSAQTSIFINTWNHVVVVVQSGAPSILYINGIQAAIGGTTPINAPLTTSASICAPDQLKMGGQCGNLTSIAFAGYIDDFRIYNTALTAAEVAQLYANNAYSTTPSTYLTPRSYVYTTPAIPANSWQRVALTIPGDMAGSWPATFDAGLDLSVCLASSAHYGTSNVGAWNSLPYYGDGATQLLGASSSNLLADVGNSLYITGVQLERGSAATGFERNPVAPVVNPANGYVGIGTAKPQAALDVNGTIACLSTPIVSSVVAFMATNAAYTTTINGGSIFPYNNVVYNYGSGYNVASSEFIAPYKGLYQFNWSGFIELTNPALLFFGVDLHVGSTTYPFISMNVNPATGDYPGINGSISVVCNQGDSVYLVATLPVGSTSVVYRNFTFNGALIHRII